MNTNEAMYKAACEQRSKLEDYPVVLVLITPEKAVKLWNNRDHEHHVSLGRHVWFTSSGLPYRSYRGKTELMSWDAYMHNKKLPVSTDLTLAEVMAKY